MKNMKSLLTINEHHPPHTDPPNQIIHKAVTAWIVKAFHK